MMQDQPIAGPRRWLYVSADAIATVNTAGYFANGYDMGMRVGDSVEVRDTATPTTSLCTVISATVGGDVDLSDGTALSQVVPLNAVLNSIGGYVLNNSGGYITYG